MNKPSITKRIRALFHGNTSSDDLAYLLANKESIPPKGALDLDRFREIISDPLNLLIRRVPSAGMTRGEHVTLHNGNVVKYKGGSYYGKFSEILVINRGVHEPLEEYVFQQVLDFIKKSSIAPIMLELGAYWGHYSMWAQSVVPETKTILVEPDKKNIEIGRQNFAANRFEGIFLNDFVSHNHFCIDRFMAAQNIKRLTILHSDIQGFEQEMLEGASHALENHQIEHVFLSTHSDALHAACKSNLTAKGYAVLANADVSSQTTSCDGFIYATLPNLAKSLSLPSHYLGRAEIPCLNAAKTLEYLQSIHNSTQTSHF